MYLECKTERIVGISCLDKKFVFQSEISTYSLIIRLFFFKNIEILSDQGNVQTKPNTVSSIPWVTRL